MVGETGENDGRLALGRDEELHEPAMVGIRDEHLRAVDDEPAVAPGQRRPHRPQIAAHLRFGGREHRQRPSPGQPRQVTGLLLGCPEGDQCRHRPDGRVDREHPRGGRHRGGDPRHAPHQVDDRPPAPAVGRRHEDAPQPRLPQRRLGSSGKQSLRPRWRVVERCRRQPCRRHRGVEQAGGAEVAEPLLGLPEDRGDSVREGLGTERGSGGKPAVIPARPAPQRRADAGGGPAFGAVVPMGHIRHAWRWRGGDSGVERGSEVMGDRRTLQFHGRGHLPAVDVEGAVDEHEAPHPPGPGERLLPAGEPASEPAKETRMAEGRAPRHDPQVERPDGGPEDGGLRHDQRHRHRQPIATDTHLGDDRVGGEGPLDFGRRELRAGGENKRVDDPSGDPDPAVGGDLGGVAGGDPVVLAAVFGGGLDRDVGGEKLPDGPRRRTHEELAGSIETDVDASQRLADPPRPVPSRAVEGDHRTGLGQSVTLDERDTPRGKQRLRPFPERRPAGDADPHSTTERGGEVGDRPRPDAPFEPLEERRHSQDHRRWQESAGLEEMPPVGDDIQTAAADQRRGEIPRAGQRVAHRQPRQADIGRLVEEDCRGSEGIRGE